MERYLEPEALMLQTRTITATRRLVMTTLPPRLNLQSPRRSRRLFALATRTLHACDGIAHTKPSLTGLMPSS
eukprot:931628-Pleurochrysis_carterae.AAC.1